MFFRNIEAYKYMLIKPVEYCLPESLRPTEPIYSPTASVRQITVLPTGLITISPGYCWDGASGPTLDDNSNMFAALIHDALYQLIREGKLDKGCRKHADDVFYRLLLAHGMPKWRAWYYYQGVRLGGWWAARKHDDHKYRVYVA